MTLIQFFSIAFPAILTMLISIIGFFLKNTLSNITNSINELKETTQKLMLSNEKIFTILERHEEDIQQLYEDLKIYKEKQDRCRHCNP